jgi:hypothetical protein
LNEEIYNLKFKEDVGAEEGGKNRGSKKKKKNQ